MKMPQNKFFCKASFSIAKIFFALGFFALVSCQTNPVQTLSELPSAIKNAADNASDKNYPDLRKIPPKPENLVSDKEWASQDKDLQKNAVYLEAQPNSVPLTAEELNLDWANKLNDLVVNNPKSAPYIETESADAWAARMRAKLDESDPELKK